MSKKLDVERMTERPIYITYTYSRQGSTLTLYHVYRGWSDILATSLLQIIWHSIQTGDYPVLKNIYLGKFGGHFELFSKKNGATTLPNTIYPLYNNYSSILRANSITKEKSKPFVFYILHGLILWIIYRFYSCYIKNVIECYPGGRYF